MGEENNVTQLDPVALALNITKRAEGFLANELFTILDNKNVQRTVIKDLNTHKTTPNIWAYGRKLDSFELVWDDDPRTGNTVLYQQNVKTAKGWHFAWNPQGKLFLLNKKQYKALSEGRVKKTNLSLRKIMTDFNFENDYKIKVRSCPQAIFLNPFSVKGTSHLEDDEGNETIEKITIHPYVRVIHKPKNFERKYLTNYVYNYSPKNSFLEPIRHISYYASKQLDYVNSQVSASISNRLKLPIKNRNILIAANGTTLGLLKKTYGKPVRNLSRLGSLYRGVAYVQDTLMTPMKFKKSSLKFEIYAKSEGIDAHGRRDKYSTKYKLTLNKKIDQ